MPKAFKCNNLTNHVRFSLKTKNLQVALILARRISVMYDELAKNYFDTEYGYLQGKKLLERYRDLSNRGASFAEFEESLFAELETSTDAKFFKKALDYAKAIAISRDDYSLLPDYFKSQKNSSNNDSEFLDKNIDGVMSKLETINNNLINQRIAHLEPKKLSEAMEIYISQCKLEWTKDGGSEQKYRAIFRLFLDITGDIQTTELKREHVNQYKMLVLNYPANKNKNRKYKHLSTKEIIHANVDDADKLKLRSKAVYFGHVSSFLEFASKSEWALPDINNTLVGIVSKKAQQAIEDRNPYTNNDLNSLFNSKAYLECKHKEPFMYWAPLIGLLSGARQNEICQLFLEDIFFHEEAKIWLFNINKNNSAVTLKSLKKHHHKRLVPIHKTLIKLGLLDYVEHLKKRGEIRLFPELPYQGNRNKYATRMTKWFNNTYTNKANCNIKTPKTCFHSLRHNVINYFAHKLNLNSSRFAYVIGQSASGNVSDTTYIKRSDIIQYNEWFSKLDFSYCIDFKKIPHWKRFPFARKL